MVRRAKSQSMSSDASISKASSTPGSPTSNLPTYFQVTSPVHLSPPASPVSAPLVNGASSNDAPPQSHTSDSVRFPIVLVLNLILSAVLFTMASALDTGDLANVSKHTEDWLDVAGLLAWKVVLTGVYWFGGFDVYDTLSLSLLLITPQTILLSLFFDIRPTSLILNVLASTASATLPIAILRPLSTPHHATRAAKGSLRNRPIITDPLTTIATSFLATAIFATILEFSFATFLPTWLIVHFSTLRNLTRAHLGAEGLPYLLVSLIPAGYAAREFLFVSSTAVPLPPVKYSFDTTTAGFLDHVRHNLWGWYSARQKELISRTVLLTALVVGETILQAWGTLQGVEFKGAVGYAGMWGMGVLLLGAVFDWVGAPSG